MSPNRAQVRRWCGAMCLAAVVSLAGCSNGTSGDGSTTSTVDPSVQTQLRQDVRSLADALAADHLAQARTALAALNADTAAAYAAGKLDRDHLGRIRAATAVLSRDLEQRSSTPAATVTVTPTPTVTVTADPPPPPPPKAEGRDDHGKDGGPAKGDDHEKKDKPHDHGPGKGKP
jgi:hypothetical protein